MLVIIALIFIGILWLFMLTFLIFKLSSHYNSLLKGTSATSLQSVLDLLIRDVSETKKGIELVKSTCATIEKEGHLHIQKIGLRRFNPFEDTGGDQSFILALLDGRNTGVVVSGLYSRSGTRWYAKNVTEGKGVEHELSSEEKKAIRDAK